MGAKTYTIETATETIRIQACTDKSATRIALKAMGATDYYLFAQDGGLIYTTAASVEAPCAGLD